MSVNNNHNKSDVIFKDITHVIFDLDGTLIDTEFWGLQNLNSLLAPYGHCCTAQVYGKHIGLDTRERAQRLIDEFSLNCNLDQFHMDWILECRRHISDLTLMPGAVTLIKHLYSHGIPLAIATAGKREHFDSKVQLMGDVFEEGNYFRHIIHGDDERVERPKPYPDIYEVCVKQFSPEPQPQNILVFEDNPIGLSAAMSAGMRTVLVNDKRFAEYNDTNADVVITSLQDFKPIVEQFIKNYS